MNALDRLISVFAPEAAYRRAQYRAAMQVTLAYDGAKSGRRTDGWVSGSGDVNTEVGAALIALRNRSRDLLGNNPYARKAVNELVSNTVGTGIKPQSMYPTLVVKEKLQAPWSLWANEADAAG